MVLLKVIISIRPHATSWRHMRNGGAPYVIKGGARCRLTRPREVSARWGRIHGPRDERGMPSKAGGESDSMIWMWRHLIKSDVCNKRHDVFRTSYLPEFVAVHVNDTKHSITPTWRFRLMSAGAWTIIDYADNEIYFSMTKTRFLWDFDQNRSAHTIRHAESVNSPSSIIRRLFTHHPATVNGSCAWVYKVNTLPRVYEKLWSDLITYKSMRYVKQLETRCVTQ